MLMGIRFCFFVLIILSTECVSIGYTPTDNYLLNCGSSTNATIDNRVFVADESTLWMLSTPENVLVNTSKLVSSFASSALYQTARVFAGPSSYTFPIQKSSRHYIRLYFFPFVEQGYNLTATTFTVSVQNLILLDNFQPRNASSAVSKEYSINMTSDTLVLTFTPSGGSSLAFVNAIELVSHPDNLIADTARSQNTGGTYDGISEQTLETVYRINMGGLMVTPANDTLWRTWIPDQEFLVSPSLATFVKFASQINYDKGGATPDIAPDAVYSTATRLASSNFPNALFNVTWEFNVDQSSIYLIRMHFCDVVSKSLNILYFNVYINSWFAQRDLDLSTLTFNSLAAPYYIDFVAGASNGSGQLRVSIGPPTLNNALPDGILNGLEIMKFNQNTYSAEPAPKHRSRVILGLVLGAFLVVIIIVLFMVFTKKKLLKKYNSNTWVLLSFYGGNSHSAGSKSSSRTVGSYRNCSDLGLKFPLVVLQEATNNFDGNWVIGVGGFGKVYVGELKDGTKVAVKRGNPKSQQGLKEFHTEIEMLSRLRHRHVVSLIGYCDDENEMILVYEYMQKGTLKSHLYGSDNPNLAWKQRLKICIGAAKGLHYLHTGQAKAIIHRDVKSANILLDEKLLAKVADFGLSKTGPEMDETHVSTAVKGSVGYLDPEYFTRQQLSEKSDVYSFGVVLLEVLCGRQVIDPSLSRDMVNLAEWAMKLQKRGELEKIIDPCLAGKIKSDSFWKFAEIATKCLEEYSADRPTMAEVLWNLEYALQLEEAIASDFEVNSISRLHELAAQCKNAEHQKSTTSLEEFHFSGQKNLHDLSMSRVFSELIKAEAR